MNCASDSCSDCCLFLRGKVREVRPDEPEVVRAKFLAGDCAAGCSFDGQAVLDWHLTGFPVGNNLWADFHRGNNSCSDSGFI